MHLFQYWHWSWRGTIPIQKQECKAITCCMASNFSLWPFYSWRHKETRKWLRSQRQPRKGSIHGSLVFYDFNNSCSQSCCRRQSDKPPKWKKLTSLPTQQWWSWSREAKCQKTTATMWAENTTGGATGWYSINDPYHLAIITIKSLIYQSCSHLQPAAPEPLLLELPQG